MSVTRPFRGRSGALKGLWRRTALHCAEVVGAHPPDLVGPHRRDARALLDREPGERLPLERITRCERSSAMSEGHGRREGRFFPPLAQPFTAYPGPLAGYELPPEHLALLRFGEDPVCAVGHVYAPPPHIVSATMPPTAR